MPVERCATTPSATTVEECRTIYMDAFSRTPYCEDPSAGDLFVERVKKYAQRSGFALDVARSDRLAVGFALSVLAEPGDWWRDKVAAFLGQQLAEEWLGSTCREVVHVAVSPERQGQGHGRRLVQHLLRSAGARTTVLSCHPDAAPAQRLYLATGFRVISKTFATEPGDLGYWLMGRVVP